MATPITTKNYFYRLWDEGLLGNKPRTWTTIEEAEKSGFKGPVAIRYRGTSGGGPFIPDLTIPKLAGEMQKLIAKGYRPEQFGTSEQITPGKIQYLINGEVIRTSAGLALHYSLENLLMRPALRKSQHNVCGLAAHHVLRRYLWNNDLESLIEIMDEYPDHTVEFSGFNIPVGIIPNRRMIIWEVRYY